MTDQITRLHGVCLQGAGLQVDDPALPVESFIAIGASGYDQLNTALTLTLSFNDGSVKTICYTGISVGMRGQQCASDCTQCTPTYTKLILQPYPIGSTAQGSCGTCA
jgi:hypothetical protein